MNRIVISAGVAYGTPTEKVREILLKIAREHPRILETPESVVTFESFGDSSLNFSIRVFPPDMENRLSVIHDLHTTVHEALNEAGISIPFPQRDLHTRTAELPLASQSGRPPVAGQGDGFGV